VDERARRPRLTPRRSRSARSRWAGAHRASAPKRLFRRRGPPSTRVRGATAAARGPTVGAATGKDRRAVGDLDAPGRAAGGRPRRARWPAQRPREEDGCLGDDDERRQAQPPTPPLYTRLSGDWRAPGNEGRLEEIETRPRIWFTSSRWFWAVVADHRRGAAALADEAVVRLDRRRTRARVPRRASRASARSPVPLHE
jgi:hypothetical protein